MKTVAVIPAAGAGVRMGAGKAKQFLDLDGKPILAVTLESFQVCPSVGGIILVVPKAEIDHCRKEIVEHYRLDKVMKVVPGGKRRQDSVRMGIEATEGRFELVIIHDGVRPLIRPDLIERVTAAGKKERAVIVAMPAKETVKSVDPDGLIVKTHDRRRIWLVQTPQIFRYEEIWAAHKRALEEGWENLTDDAMLAEKAGIPVKVIEGSEDNIKVTTSHDLNLARFLLRNRDRGV